jgi:hypothetical protein
MQYNLYEFSIRKKFSYYCDYFFTSLWHETFPDT